MKLEEFNLQMARLRIKFGVKVYDQETTELIWKGLSRLPDGVFTDAVDLAIGELRPNQAPMLPELSAFVQRAVERRPRPSITNRACTECGSDGLGYVLFRDNLNGGQFVAVCTVCESGHELRAKLSNKNTNPPTPPLTIPQALPRYELEQVYPPSAKDSIRRTPWPESVEGLLLILSRKKRKGLHFALQYNKITLDEAEYLLNAARKKAWADEWAREILAKVPGSKNVVARITETLQPRI